MSAALATASPSNWRSRISAVRYWAGRLRCYRAMTRTSRMWRVRWREWIDNQGIDVLADGAASSSGLAIQQVCREALAATPGFSSPPTMFGYALERDG